MASVEAARCGFKLRACEPGPHARQEFAKRLGFEPDPTFFTGEYAEQNRGQFDAALLSHVLEHILDLDKFVQDMRIVLKPGSSLIIAVPHFGSILTTLMGRSAGEGVASAEAARCGFKLFALASPALMPARSLQNG